MQPGVHSGCGMASKRASLVAIAYCTDTCNCNFQIENLHEASDIVSALVCKTRLL